MNQLEQIERTRRLRSQQRSFRRVCTETFLGTLILNLAITATSDVVHAKDHQEKGRTDRAQYLSLTRLVAGPANQVKLFFQGKSSRRKTVTLPKNAFQVGLASFDSLDFLEGYNRSDKQKSKATATPRPIAELLAALQEDTGLTTQQGFIRYALYRSSGGIYVHATQLSANQVEAIRQSLERREEGKKNRSAVFFEKRLLRSGSPASRVVAKQNGFGGQGNGCNCYNPPPPPPTTCGCYGSNPPLPTAPANQGGAHGWCSVPGHTPCGTNPQTGYQWCCVPPLTCNLGTGPGSGCSSQKGECVSGGYTWTCDGELTCGTVPGTCNPTTGGSGSGLSDPPVEPPAPGPRCQLPQRECTYANNVCMLQEHCDACKKYGRSGEGPIAEGDCLQHCTQIANTFFDYCMRTSDLPQATKAAYCGQAREAEFERCKGGCQTCALRRDGGRSAEPPPVN